MKITVITGILCASAFLIVKMIFFYTMPVGYDIVPLVLINMFLLLLAISLGLYLAKNKETEYTNALSDIKNGMTAGVPYAVIVSVFLYFYYAQIDPEYNAHRIADAEYILQEKLDDPKELAKIKKENADFEVASKEEIREKFMEGYRSSLAPRAVLTLSLLGLIVMSAMNSIFVTIIYRRIVFRSKGSS